jgi:hypothetical protein
MTDREWQTDNEEKLVDELLSDHDEALDFDGGW